MSDAADLPHRAATRIGEAAHIKGSDEYYTLKGYQIKESPSLSYAMEDYLEMICRISRAGGELRVRDIALGLHVKPSSVTKMLQNLSREGYIKAERYGFIYLTERGRDAGEYLLYRHDVITGFLCALNGTKDETETAEKIEHYLDADTVGRLRRLTEKMKAWDRGDGHDG